MRVVKPNLPANYSSVHLTPGKRLLYYFWRFKPTGQSEAVKRLGMITDTRRWDWVITPEHPGFATLDAFKIACDHRRGQSISPALLYKALGLTMPENLPIL